MGLEDWANKAMDSASEAVDSAAESLADSARDIAPEWADSYITKAESFVKNEEADQTLRQEATHDPSRAQEVIDYFERTGDDAYLKKYLTSFNKVSLSAEKQQELSKVVEKHIKNPNKNTSLAEEKALYETINTHFPEAAKATYARLVEGGFSSYQEAPPALAGLPRHQMQNIYHNNFRKRPSAWLATFPNSDIPSAEAVEAFALEEAERIRYFGKISQAKTDFYAEDGLFKNPKISAKGMEEILEAAYSTIKKTPGIHQTKNLKNIGDKIENHPNKTDALIKRKEALENWLLNLGSEQT